MAAIVAEAIAVLITRFAGSAPWEARYGYSRVVVAGGWAITAGTTATGLDGVVLHPGDSYRQALRPSRSRSMRCRQRVRQRRRWCGPGCMSPTSPRRAKSGERTGRYSGTFVL